MSNKNSSSSSSGIWSSITPATPAPTPVPVPVSSKPNFDDPYEPDIDDQGFGAPVKEPFVDKLVRKCKEAPVVPIGFLATCACLTLGVMAMGKGDKRRQQLMMRGRVVAQGATIAGIVFWIFNNATTGKTSQQVARENEAQRDQQYRM